MRKVVVFSLISLMFSCSSGKKEEKEKVNWTKEKSLELGKEIAIEEDLMIRLYLEQHKNMKFIKTGTGLQYLILKQGDGDSAKAGHFVFVDYKISLLDGKVCYQTDADHYDKLIVDRSDVQSGIQEGLKKMRVGDSSKMIMPSHLANGLVGDLENIPPLSPIIVDISLKQIQK